MLSQQTIAVKAPPSAAASAEILPPPGAGESEQELDTDSITVLADRGYYTGECLRKCEQDQITTVVSNQNPPSSTGNQAYTLDKFKYDQENDCYICPQGQILPNVSKAEAKEKMYRSKACKNCPHKDECTKNKRGRQIIRGEYHDIMTRADERLARNMTLYKQRQMIVEHPFGTIKRKMGYTHFLLRGIEKMRGEAVIHCLMYNLKRVLKILGTDKLAAAIRKFSAFTSKIAAVSLHIRLFRPIITCEYDCFRTVWRSCFDI